MLLETSVIVRAILREAGSEYSPWRKLIVRHGVKGVPVHDARIAAAMQTHGRE